MAAQQTALKFGVALNAAPWAADVGALREYVQAAEQLGYERFGIASHVLGVDFDHHPSLPKGPHDYRSPWHDPLTLFAYLAACTSRIHFLTSILLLPALPTALVAKQAAQVDLLSGGRLHLGVAVSWNALEYEALGADFHTRGRRIEEQIKVLRLLWTQPTVEFEGQFHRIRHAGINPRPPRPIPIWLGAGAAGPGVSPTPPARLLRRIGTLADGWIALSAVQPADAGAALVRIRKYAQAVGRDPRSVGLEGGLLLGGRTPEEWRDLVSAWERSGATHLRVATGAGRDATVADHIAQLKQFRDAVPWPAAQ